MLNTFIVDIAFKVLSNNYLETPCNKLDLHVHNCLQSEATACKNFFNSCIYWLSG